MPETLTMSTGVSLGLLAGIVSGVCYIIANGLAWPVTRSHQEPSERRRCLQGAGGVCRRCGGDLHGGIPCICDKESSAKFESGLWFLKQVQKTLSLMPWSISSEKLEQIAEESDGAESPDREVTREELRNVREFLETLSARLAGGSLEGTRVAPLYHHPAYMNMMERHHTGLRDCLAALSGALRAAIANVDHLPRRAAPDHSAATSSGASGAHAQLKRLVARVVEEAAALPALARYAAEPTTPTDATTYEDLLATAILNKVVERYQNENGSGGRSSGIHSASASPTPSERSSPRSLHGRRNRDISPPLREEEEVSDWEEGEATASDEALETPRRVPFPEYGGDIVHHTDNEEREYDEASSSDIQAVDGSWEENWLFQKKKIKTLQSVPVPMLVPNSNTEYRAMIGDRDVDDTTDLSDNASEVEEELEYKSNIKRVLDSKHVIGGIPKPEDEYEPDSLTIADEIVNDSDNEYNEVIDATNTEVNNNSNNTMKADDNENGSVLVYPMDSGPIPKAEFNLKEEIHRTLMNGHGDDYSELNGTMNFDIDNDVTDGFVSGKGSATTTLSRHEREGEYEETVTLPVQRYADSLRRKHFDDERTEIPTRDTHNDALIPGTVAYRERLKWLNAVEMPNNPYSPEAIQRRLTAKSTSSLFDMITSKSNSIDDDLTSVKSEVITRKVSKAPLRQQSEDNHIHKQSLAMSMDNVMNGSRSNSPSPRILKDVLAEEVPTYKRYGRDYYIREAKKSSGGRKKSSSDASSLSSMNHSMSLNDIDREFTSPGLLIKQFNTIASNQNYTKFATKDEKPEPISIVTNKNKTNILIEYEDVNEQTLFAAKPVYVDDDTDKKFEEILQSAYSNGTAEINSIDDISEEPKSPNNLSRDSVLDNSYVSSSSLDDSLKIYNIPTGEIVKTKSDALSERHIVLDKNDNIDMNFKNTSLDRLSQNGDASEESLVIIENLDSLNSNKLENISELEEILPQLPKVKELAKKFLSMDSLNEPVQPTQQIRRKKSIEDFLNDAKADKPKTAYMHSLTARSISKEFREELKLSMATPLKVPGGSKDIPEGEEVIKESSRPGSPLPEPGTIKAKLAFFESLKSKFSSK